MNNKKKMVGAFLIILGFMMIVAGLVYFFNRPETSKGSKAVTIEVVNKEGTSKVYKVKTDAEYLREAMEDAKGLEFSGTESEYGMFVETVNGETADYSADGAYWSFYVNDEYCNYGIDSQPVYDGDAFKIVYDVYVG